MLDDRVLIARGQILAVPAPRITESLGYLAAGYFVLWLTPRLASSPSFYYMSGGVLGFIITVLCTATLIYYMAARRQGTELNSVQYSMSAFVQMGWLYLLNNARDIVRSYLKFLLPLGFAIFTLSVIVTRRWMMKEDGVTRIPGIMSDSVVTIMRVLAAYLMTEPIRHLCIWRTGCVLILVILFFGVPKMRERMESASPPPLQHPQPRRLMTEAEYQALGISYTDMSIRKQFRPDLTRTPEERAGIEWLCRNHARIQLTKIPCDVIEEEGVEDDGEDETTTIAF
jgi:hypothetical protein